VEKVKRARKKVEKKPETETPEIQTSETPTEPEATEISIEPETKKHQHSKKANKTKTHR
jgi:hypothetical protein